MTGIPRESGIPVAPSEAPATTAPVGPSEPTSVELRAAIRILLHIGRQGRFGPHETPTAALTQKGMAEALGLSQGAISNALGRLVDGGVLAVERMHVQREMLRLNVYQLTPDGEELVRRLRARYGTAGPAHPRDSWPPAYLPYPDRRPTQSSRPSSDGRTASGRVAAPGVLGA